MKHAPIITSLIACAFSLAAVIFAAGEWSAARDAVAKQVEDHEARIRILEQQATAIAVMAVTAEQTREEVKSIRALLQQRGAMLEGGT